MEILVETTEQAVIVTIKGQLNATTTAEIQDQVLVVAQPGKHILLDMTQVDYLSSAGLRMLLLLYRHVRDQQGYMALVGLSEEVADIMAITGFLDLFVTYSDRKTGLRALMKAS